VEHRVSYEEYRRAAIAEEISYEKIVEAKHGFELEGAHWPTAEHYFQAQKFRGTAHAGTIRQAGSARQAAELGRLRSAPIREDWDRIKDDVMRTAVRAKFSSHAALRDLLLSTGGEELIERSTDDYYWGCGADGTGKNMLGKILMEIRAELRR
jgi:ribA/ribD-fused uncharacterized protein